MIRTVAHQHHRLVVLWSSLIVAHQPAVAKQPAEGPLHHPPAGYHLEHVQLGAFLMIWTVRSATARAQAASGLPS